MTSSEHISKEQPRDSIYIRLPAEDRQKYGEDKLGILVKSMSGTQDTSHVWQLDYVNLTCGVRRIPPRQTQFSIVP